ncbi:MAG: SAM-dependent methyltransferase [Myxococcaceae bacterium]|nr:SAM-dependent methyltransferase [Myxococcaceae bacterium]
MSERDEGSAALIALGRALREAGYAFVTVTPETHRRVHDRAAASGRATARSLRDAFGWSRPFEASLLSPAMMDLARAAGILVEERSLLRSKVRFSSIGERLFVHSAYPTTAADAVFFGPDTYRYADLVAGETKHAARSKRVVDIGCGSGAGGIIAAPYAERIVLADVNAGALSFARVNAVLAGIEDRVEIVESDVLRSVDGPIDLVIANPPYMMDPASRAYRDGGGSFGEALGVRIAREALARLEPGGRLVLYTGAAVVDGVDTFLRAVRDVCVDARADWRYREIDPDVFGEEIEQNDAYANVERIAAVALVATMGAPSTNRG